jgi:hypothetical protein
MSQFLANFVKIGELQLQNQELQSRIAKLKCRITNVFYGGINMYTLQNWQ